MIMRASQQPPLPSSASLLIAVRKEHTHHVNVNDAKPKSVASLISNDDDRRCCNVCQQNEARYTCPRCNLPFCSVPCYRNHHSAAAGGAANGDHDNGHHQCCTEGFYQNRVSQVVDLEIKAKKEDTNRMLHRVHQQQQQDTMLPLSSASSFSDNNSLKLPQQELLRMLHVIESGDEKEISRMILASSAAIKPALLDAVQRGELQDWILEPWKPWWRPDLQVFANTEGSSNSDDDADDPDSDDEASSLRVPAAEEEKTLDERLLQVTKLSNISHGKKRLVADLTFNLVDILYSIVRTLRLYHGFVNAKECVAEAADFLVCGSSVLARDARWNSVHEALAEATNKSSSSSTSSTSTIMNKNNNGDCHTRWTVLAQDVAIICIHRRFVGRALLEAIDILKGAIVVAKKEGNSDLGSSLRKIKKKLEFYLSWSQGQQQQTVLSSGNLGQQIETWISSWQRVEDEGQNDELGDIIIPHLSKNQKKSMDKEATHPTFNTATANNAEEPFLLREVSIKRR